MIETSNDNEINILTNSGIIINKSTTIPFITSPQTALPTTPTNLDPNLFTFKPHINPKSALLTQNLINFYERQNQHIRKQTDMVSFYFIYLLFFFFVEILCFFFINIA